MPKKTISPASDDNDKRHGRRKSRSEQRNPARRTGSSPEIRSVKAPYNPESAPRSESQIRLELLEIYQRHALEADDTTQAAHNAISEIRTTTLPLELADAIILDYSRIRITGARADARYTLKMAAKGDEKAIASVKASQETWLDGYFVGGKRLRNCTADDLIASANSKKSMADGLLTAHTFERTLAASIGSRTVGEVMTDKQIQRLWKDLEKRY